GWPFAESCGDRTADSTVLRPLQHLARDSERLGKGDLSTRTGAKQHCREFQQLAQSFNQMAASLQQRQDEIEAHEQELQRINRALQTLSAGNHALVRATDEAALLQEMCRVAVEVGGYRIAWVGSAEHHAQKPVRMLAQAGADSRFFDDITISWDDTAYGYGPTGTAIRTGKHCVAHGMQSEPRYRAWHAICRAQGIDSAVSFPLYVNNEILGAFTLYSEDHQAFAASELALLEEMAEDLAYGINSLRTRSQHDAAQATIRRMAYFDDLTDLPNHTSLEELLGRSLDEARQQQHSLALMLIDLARLRDINDTLGFEAGNKVMQETAQRIRRACSNGEFIARMRGDEFAILLPGADSNTAEHMAQDLLKLLHQPFAIDDLALVVRMNIGIVLFPDHGGDAEQLLQHADVALQLAKTSGNGYALYSPERDIDKKRHLALASDLNHALEDGLLELHYQPKVSMQSGRVIGFEALARWPHPEQGMIAPDEFIPLAERTGLIRALTDWALKSSLCQLHEWRAVGINLPVAVNLSAYNFQDPQLLDKVRDWSARWDLPQGLLELEITESAMMADPVAALVVLSQLRGLGIPLYIDDFGTGYSSLSYLKKLPVTSLKIDKSFVADMLEDAETESIVRSTITLAHDLGLSVVAEGVEDADVWARLQRHGCDSAQGYYMGRPMPAAQVIDWLQTSPWGIRSEHHESQPGSARR
ncbi:MAG: EAL domain-containing protein, partial [Gammaproteobacteria bacterium]